MKICHVVYECFPGSYRGGVQKMVYELGLAQAAAGAQVEVWTIGNSQDVRLSPGLLIRYFVGNDRWFSSTALNDALDGAGFDAVHAHNTFLPLNRYAAAAFRRGQRVFFNSHGALDPLLLRPNSLKGLKKLIYARMVERRNYHAATALVGLTIKEVVQIRRLVGPRPAVVAIPNGIVLPRSAKSQEVQRFREQWNLPDSTPAVLYIGRITPKKNLEGIIDALAAVKRVIPEVVLLVAGRQQEEPAYAASLMERASLSGVGESIRWIGHLDEDGKVAAFAVGNLFVHASHSEGMALAILEAMACGLPVVATAGCNMDEAAAAEALCQVPDDTGALAAALIRMLQSPETARNLGWLAGQYVRAHHDWGRIAQAYLTLYRTGAPHS